MLFLKRCGKVGFVSFGMEEETKAPLETPVALQSLGKEGREEFAAKIKIPWQEGASLKTETQHEKALAGIQKGIFHRDKQICRKARSFARTMAYGLYYNLQKDIELARLTARLIDYKDKVIIGEIYKYTSEELLMINAKVVVRNGTLYLVECNTAVHGTVCGVINTKIAIALDSNESKLPSACFISVGDAEFRSYVNMLECGTPHVKIPDGTFMASLEEGLPRISKWFVVEVGFRNEDFKDLLIEGSSWVNKYSDTEFCMILWIKEATRNGVQNVDSIKIVVFQRITRFYSDVPNPPKKECKRWSCEDQREALDKTKTQLQVELRCKIIHKQDVTDESIDGGEQVVVTLPTAGSERYFGEALFEEAEIELNLTDAFRIIFREIRGMRRVGTYPY